MASTEGSGGVGGGTRLENLKSQVEETQRVLEGVAQKTRRRGERLERLEEQAVKIEEEAAGFHRMGKKKRNRKGLRRCGGN